MRADVILRWLQLSLLLIRKIITRGHSLQPVAASAAADEFDGSPSMLSASETDYKNAIFIGLRF
eukprot:6140993-Amphidinium_carterae.1